VYDPYTALFLSPDPYIQAPDFTQNYNRYAYVLNNPLRYTDPSGELFFGMFTFVFDLIHTIFSGGLSGNEDKRNEAWKQFDPTASWSKTNKAFLIDYYTFIEPKNDYSDKTLRRRFLVEFPQLIIGNIAAHSLNMTGHVNEVNYFDGVVVVNTDFGYGGLTLSPYIFGKNMVPDWRDHTFVHEYGHTIQSKKWGWLYLPFIAYPSLLSATIDNNGKWYDIGEHHDRWFEAQASRFAADYFERHYSSSGFDRLYFEVGYSEYIAITGQSPSYLRNRYGFSEYQGAHPISGNSHWSDFNITGGGINYFVSLIMNLRMR
jgi:hypothetical protein